MSDKVNMKLVIEELHKAFENLNITLFENELPTPALLVQSRGNKKRVAGWCSTNQIWVNPTYKELKYEINIVAEYLNRDKYSVIGTLLHEMVHLYNLTNNIKDVSRNGTYHNKKFKSAAEEHGLVVEYNSSIGWAVTNLKDETKEIVDKMGLDEKAFTMARVDFFNNNSEMNNGEGIKKVESSSRKYVCPSCNTIIRATKEVKIICGDCGCEFELTL